MNYHKPLCLVKVRDDSVREDEQHKVVGRLPTVGLGYKTVLWIQILYMEFGSGSGSIILAQFGSKVFFINFEERKN